MTPATTWKEQVAPDEEERFTRHAETLHRLQQGHARGGRASRALHAKGNCGVLATFTTLADLPEHARVGLFASPATYSAYVRFSNGAGAHQPDKKPDVRGIAIKVLGVKGKKIIPGMEDAPTQDFLAIRSATTPFRNADEFVCIVRAASNPALLLPRAFLGIGVRRTLAILGRMAKELGAPITSVSTTRYFSALPIRFGDYAARFAVTPRPAATAAATDAPQAAAPDYLAADLHARLLRGPVEYDFQVQFFLDEERTPIEDASRGWQESDSPYLTVARLTLVQQDTDSARGRKVAEFVEQLAFDPWHALAELRPLGNMMRARNYAYRASTQERKAGPEPSGSERFD